MQPPSMNPSSPTSDNAAPHLGIAYPFKFLYSIYRWNNVQIKA
jgi:hypothetical protein